MEAGPVYVSTSAQRLSMARIAFAFVLISLVASSLMQRYLGHVLAGGDVDFYDYYFTAQIIHDHPRNEIYAGATEPLPQPRSAPPESELFRRARASGHADVELYLYPPLLADFLAPVSKLQPHLAASAWRAFNLLLVFASALLVARLIRIKWLSPPFALLLFAFYSYWPINEAIVDGQISVALFFLWAAAALSYSNKRIVLSALALALATAIKVSPIIIVFVLLIFRDWRWIRYYLGCLAFLLLFMGWLNGWHTLGVYTHVMNAMNQGSPTLQNKSLGALVQWLANGRAASLDNYSSFPTASPALVALSKALSAFFCLLCLGLTWRWRLTGAVQARVRAIAIFALVTCLISPVSWRHGYAVALLPLAILWAESLRTPQTRLRIWLLALTSVITGSLCMDLMARVHLPNSIELIAFSSWSICCAVLVLEVLSSAPADTETKSNIAVFARHSLNV